MTRESEDIHRQPLAPPMRSMGPSTPPESPPVARDQLQLPGLLRLATPPSSSHSESLDGATRHLYKQLKALAEAKEPIATCPSPAQLTAEQYRELRRAIASDAQLRGWFEGKARFSWTPPTADDAGIFALHMPSAIHDYFVNQASLAINEEIRKIGEEAKKTENYKRAQLVAKIKMRTTDRIRTKNGGERDPDGGFSFKDHAARMVVIEAMYSHKIDLERTAKQFVRSGSHLMLGFDLGYNPRGQRMQADASAPKSATYTMFRRLRTFNPKTNTYHIRVQAIARNQSFLTDDKDPASEAEGMLELYLSDFCPTDQLEGGSADDLPICIPHSQLTSLLHDAAHRRALFNHHEPDLSQDEDDFDSDVDYSKVRKANDTDFDNDIPAKNTRAHANRFGGRPGPVGSRNGPWS